MANKCHLRRSERSCVSMNENGFTLTELLVVMVILSLLAAALTPQIMGRLDSSKIKAARLQAETIGMALDMYKIDTGRYPTTREGLVALVMKPEGVENWDGPYVKSGATLIDPWKRAFLYKSKSGGLLVATLGADGEEGGERSDADIRYPDYSMLSDDRF